MTQGNRLSRQLKPSRSNKTENKTALEMRAKEITKAPTGSLPMLEIGSDFPLGPNHADRSQIEPSAEDVERLSAQQVQFTWRVSEELVHRELGEAQTTDTSSTAVGESPTTDAVAVLQRALSAQEAVTERLLEQLKAKDSQIEGMQTFMQSLNERLRESNLLMAALQKQLPLPDANLDERSGAAGKSRKRSWLKAILG